MRKWLAMLRPNPWLTRRLMMLAILVGVAVGAFCWGRHGAVPEVDAQQTRPPIPITTTGVTNTPNATTDDYSRRAVAYIYDNIPVSRAELGEYLIARFGAERLEFLVNRKIVEMQCKSNGIVITEADIDRQLAEDLKSFGPQMDLKLFKDQVLKRYNKSLYEWREDVIRPKLELSALVKPLVKVTAEDLQNEFEARYGPKVHCRMIVLKEDNPHRNKIWQAASQSEAGYKEQARNQFIPELASREGDLPPIHTHFPEAAIEKAAFELKDGQVSGLIQVKQDHSWVILRRENFVEPDKTKRFEDERMKLSQEVSDRKLQLKIPEYFQELQRRANAKLYLRNEMSQPAISTPTLAPLTPRAN
jgi:hypothetical protein